MNHDIPFGSNRQADRRSADRRKRASRKAPLPAIWIGLAALAICPAWPSSALAQSGSPALDAAAGNRAAAAQANPAALTQIAAANALPEDPSAILRAVADPAANGAGISASTADPETAATLDRAASPQSGSAHPSPGTPPPQVAPIHMKYIPPGWAAQEPLPVRDKVLLGFRDLYNPLNFAAMFASAGYEQALNGQPNYGTDRGAFGERLGAAAIRETTQGVFTDSVFSPLLHEDPRYYIEGPQHGFLHRTLYAITRPLITRTDSGHNSVNGALLLGYAASSALSYAYYPQINKNFHDTAATFGGGIGGAALGFFVSEFSGDLSHMLHRGKQP